jgi:outer membrane receptor protein involved in Fe transport
MRSLIHASGIIFASVAGSVPAQDTEADDEIVVVTASRTEQSLVEAPAAISVITDVDIERTPADDFGDLLRNVPGLNVAQTSVRDVNVTGRGSTNTLSNSLLTLLDGRSTYLDFFGINMWDLLPIQADEIKQIEVIRGPGSALYGANAMSGVVNIITKRPQDMVGTKVIVGTPYASILKAAGDEDFAYKVSAGIFHQPAYDRPAGEVPGSNPPQTYPEFENDGTTQRRVNTRFDWGLADDGYVTLGAGIASTDGIIHSGIGPFDIDHGTELSYLQADWYRNSLHVGASAQMLDGNATNLLTLQSDGLPLGFRFVNDTYDIDASNTNSIGDRHLVTYGGNFRTHDFELDIAPLADSKNERGIFVQDDIRLTDALRWVIGVRYDDIDPLRDTVLTPRTSLIYSFSSRHSIRISYNEAFRTPSAINDYLDVSILQALAPGVAVSADAVGDAELTEETLEAYEIGYVGELANDMSLTVSAYRNTTRDSIDFYIKDYYGPTNLPAPGPMLPASLIPCFGVPPGTVGACPFGGLAGIVPSDYSYRNIGRTIDRGLEFSIEQDLDDWYWWANVSWQDDPQIEGADAIDVNRSPRWRANLGFGRDPGKTFWNVTVNYQGEAYWADVLFARATTDAFTQVNASLGRRLREEKLTVKLIGQNLFDERLQQHIFGDIIERKVAAQLSFSF